MFYYPLSSLLIECLILSIVEREDSYGYEISQTVKLVANIKESTLYPILRKLEQNGYLHTYREDSDIDFEWSARVGFKVAISAFTGDGTFD